MIGIGEIVMRTPRNRNDYTYGRIGHVVETTAYRVRVKWTLELSLINGAYLPMTRPLRTWIKFDGVTIMP